MKPTLSLLLWLLLLVGSSLPALAQAPTISGFSPTSGPAGTLVTITGTNLNQVRGVRFGAGGLALFTAQAAGSLTVQVPVDAASGALRLTPATGNAVSSAGSFSYIVRPRGLATTLSPAANQDVCQARTLTAVAATPAFARNSGGINGSAESVVLQPDGKALVGGSFTSIGGTTQNCITRFNVDGTLDTGFSSGSGFNNTVNSIALQADGKIVVGGTFTTYNGASAPNLIRLNADGSVDGSFGLGSGFGYTQNRSHEVRGVVVQPDGQVLVCGLFDTFNGQPQGNVVRLNTNGSRDATFTGQRTGIMGINAIALQDDGKVLIGGGVIENLGDVQNPIYRNRIVRFTTTGTDDATFNAGGTGFYIYFNGAISNGSRVNSLAVQADGKIVAGGYFSSYNGASHPNLVRLLSTGLPDAAFTAGISREVLLVAVQRSGYILVGRKADTNESGLVRFTASGADAGLNGYTVDYAGTRNAEVSTVAEQPDGKLLIGGYFDVYTNFNTGNPTGHSGLVRVNADFSPDNTPTPVPTATFTFSPGNTTTNPLTTSTAGGYSVVASLNGETSPASNTVTLTACAGARLLDYPGQPAFSPTSGPAGTSVTILGNRLLPVQSVRFGTGGVGRITGYEQYGNDITVEVPVDAATGPLTVTLTSGQVLTTLSNFTYLPKPTGLTATLTPAGPLDLCAPRTLTATAATVPFATGTGFNATVNDVTVTLANKVLVAGDFTSFNGTTGHQGIMQLNVDGTRDTNFATSGAITLGAGGSVQCVVRYPDNTIIVGGNFTSSTGPRNLTRLYADGWANPGTIRGSFNLGPAGGIYGTGFNATVRSIVVQTENVMQNAVQLARTDYKLVVGGDFSSYNGSATNGVARVNPDGSYDGTFAVGSGANNSVYKVALQADGKVLLGGAFTVFNGTAARGLVRLNPSGSVDATLNVGTGFGAGSVFSIGVQPDGKLVLGGSFTTYKGVTQNRVVRLLADGTVDATFGTGAGFNGTVQSILVQADGKLVVGGDFTTYKGVAAVRIIRLNADGSVDTGFVPGAGANGAVTILALQANNLILAGGSFTSYNNNAGQNRLVRLSTDGTQNTTPTPISGVAFSITNASGSNPFYPPRANIYSARATLNGITVNSNTVTVTDCAVPTITSFTPTSGETGTVVTVTGTSLGDVTGVTVNNAAVAFTTTSATSLTFTTSAGTTTGVVRVTNLAGTVTGSTFTVLNPTVGGISPASGPAGTLVTITGTNLDRVRSVRFGTGGPALFTAQSATSLTVRVPVAAATGVLTLTSVVGNTTSSATFTYTPRPAGLVASLSPVGPQDACQPRTLTASAVSPAFGTGTGFSGEITGLAVQADGRVLAGGNFVTYNGATQNRLVRLLPDGSRDASFVTGTGFDGAVISVAVQADGKVLVGGSFTAYNGTTGLRRIARLNTDGSLDASFSTGTGFGSTVRSIVVQPDGKVLVVGDFSDYQGVMARRIARLNADGTRDATFVTGTGFNGTSPLMALQADGKLLVGGSFTNYNNTAVNRLIRLNADGSLDATFVTGTGVNSTVAALAVQADGKVLVGGDFTAYNGTSGLNRLIRLNANGGLDASFSTGTGFDGTVQSLTIQPDGKVLAGGGFTAFNGTTGLNRLVRLTATGALDATFGTGTGFNNTLYTTVVQPNGQVLAGGFFTTFNGTTVNYLTRLTPTGTLDTTPTSIAGATFTFSPGGSTTNPLVTSTAGSYSVVASLNGETSGASNTVTLTVCPAPTITSFTPTSGGTNTVVTVTGTNLSFASAARVNGTAGTITGTPTATSLTFTVTAGSSTGPVSVTTLGGTATSTGTFTVDPVTITNLSPASGGTGTVVTLTGTNLLGATAVKINNVAAASFTVVSATQITFTVAAGNTTGPVTVTIPGGGIATGGTFTVDPVTITSFTPTNGGPGTVVVITGTNLLGTTAVKINNVSQPGFVVNSATQITFTTSTTVTTGPVSVTTPGATATGGTFTVTPLGITAFSPVSGPAGTLVTITGTSLDQIRGVRFGTGGLALFTAQSTTSLTVVVPTDAVTGTLTLTSQLNATLSSAVPFTYTPRPAGLIASLSPAGPFDACAPRTLTATATSPAFATGTGLDANVNSLVAQADGKVLVGGGFTIYNGTAANRLLRLHPDGSADASFATGTGFDAPVVAVAVQTDGKVLVGGTFTTYKGTAAVRLLRLNADGTLDATFNIGTGFEATAPTIPSVQAVVVQPDGKILVGGSFDYYNGSFSRRIVRLNPDGSRDATFSIATGFDNTVSALAMQPDGKVLVGGLFSQYGQTAQGRITRLTATGSRDNGFFIGTGFNGSVNSLVVQPDGKLLVGGLFTQFGTTTGQNGIIRLNTNGTLDATFGTGTGFTTTVVNGMALQPDGKVVVVGQFTAYNGTTGQNRLVRLNPDGTRDASLVTGTGFDIGARRVLLQPDGNLMIGGNFTGYNGTPATRLIRLTATGSVNNAPTAVSGATFTFSPGNTTTNPLITSAAGDYTVIASLNGAVSPASNTVTLTACGTPILTSLSPTAGLVGSSVTLTGANFTAAATVDFNGTPAPGVIFTSATSLTATVPAGATTGNVTVTLGAETSNGLPFTVTLPNQAPTDLALSTDTIAENTGANVVVGQLSTTDPDAGDTFTYTLVSGAGDTDNGLVNVNGNELRIIASPDYEVQSSYAIRVRSTDQDGLWTEQVLTLTVTNVNEAPAALALSNASIPENTGANAVVGNFSTTDPDTADTFTYTLVSGAGDTDNGLVNIDGSQLRVTASPDYEMQPSYAIRVRSTDAGGLWTEQTFTVSVTDMAEDLLVSTARNVSGAYHNITVTSTGVATLTGTVQATGAVVVQAGGVLNGYSGILSGAGSFTLAAGATLEVGHVDGISQTGPTGTIQVTGPRVFSPHASYTYFMAAGTQITGTGLPLRVRDLTVFADPTLLLTQPVAVRRALWLQAGELDLAGQALTLLSDADTTAMAINHDPMNPGVEGAVVGTATVQRYLTPGTAAGVGYRHLSAPVSGSTVADLATPGFVPKVNPAYNAIPAPTLTAAQFPNVLGFDETRGGPTADFGVGYFSPASLAAPLVPGLGYAVYMKPLTPDFTGTLTTGDVTVSGLTRTGANLANTAKPGWQLLGNPYPSPIDWDLVTVPTGMSPSISVYKSTGGNSGGYLTRANGLGSLPAGLVPMGQAFFARVTGNGPVDFTFTNALRPTAYVNPNHYRPAAPAADPRPVVQLTLRGATAPAAEQTEAVVYFQAGATAGLDDTFDGPQPGHNLGAVPTLVSLTAGGEELAVNGLPETALPAGTTVELLLDLPAAGAYVLEPTRLANLPGAVALLDRLTSTRYDLATTPSVRFTVSQPGTSNGRFALVFAPSAVVTGTSHLSPLTSYLTVYPNPATGSVRVSGGAAGTCLTLLDATGRLVREWPAATGSLRTSNSALLDLTGLPAGVYTVRAGALTQRLVVQ